MDGDDQQACGQPHRPGPEDRPRRQRHEQEQAEAVAEQVEAAERLAENRAREQTAVRHVPRGDDVEDRRRRNPAEHENAADPDGQRHQRGVPQREHPVIIITTR
jgi:hypothetical protein